MKKTLFSAISWVALLTMLAKGLGMLRDILQARAFGTTAQVDQFTAANNGTIYLFTTAAYALCLAAVPILSQKLTHSREEAFQTANTLITLNGLLSLVVTAGMLCCIALGVLDPSSTADPQSFRGYAAVMAVTLPLIVTTYLLMALFQAMGHYSLQGSLSLLFNLALCGVLLFFGHHMSLWTFAVVSSAAWLLQFAMTVPYFWKEHYAFRFRLDLKVPYLPLFFRTAVVTAFTTAIFLFCYLTDTALAAPFGEGVPSAFYYADKLFTPVTTTLIYSIGAVMFPKWSEKYTAMSDSEYRSYVGTVVENTVFLLLPLTALFSAFGVPIIRVLFEGGSFDPLSTALTGEVFARYALGMVGFALLDLLAKAYYAMQNTRVPLMVNLAVLAGTALLLTAGGIALLAAFLKGRKGVLHPLRWARSLLLSAVLYSGCVFAARLLVSPGDSKALLVLKCGALGLAGLLLYLPLTGFWPAKKREY